VKRALILGAVLLSLTACSTTHRLLEPDPAARNISPEKPSGTEKRGVDPVCGASMDNAPAFGHMSYRGTLYYFDSEDCLHQFEENPDLFSAEAR
jgi:YHS domain-containing protein